MRVAVYLPLVLPMLAAASARWLAGRLHPRVATWLLTATAVGLALASGFALTALAATAIGQIPPLAALGDWSAAELRRHDPASSTLALVACLSLVISLTAAGCAAVRRAHLSCSHHLFVAVAYLAAVTNPLLRPVAAAVEYTTERWADECAASAVGDRHLVARTIAKAAQLAAGREGPAPRMNPQTLTLHGDQVDSGLGMKLPSSPLGNRIIRPWRLMPSIARRSSSRSHRSRCPLQFRQPSVSVAARKSTVTSISPQRETIVAGPL
jgi:hypothetical protein